MCVCVCVCLCVVLGTAEACCLDPADLLWAGGRGEGLRVTPWHVLVEGVLVAGGGAAANIFSQLRQRLIYSIRSVIEGTIGVFF